MAAVKGIREKVHMPLYDAVTFDDKALIGAQISQTGNVIKFFINIQNKTKLETNQQESGVLSHYNTYEARALRVILEPPKEEKPGGAQTNGAVQKFLSNFIYNSVTCFFVGEKIMMQAPTWFFPSGAGPANDEGITHGTPTPEATFRFGEPVFVSHQQNFRVEIEFPRGTDSLGKDACGGEIKGPVKVWVVIDGYLTRDVQ